MTMLRQRIAQRLVEGLSTAAMLHDLQRVDMSARHGPYAPSTKSPSRRSTAWGSDVVLRQGLRAGSKNFPLVNASMIVQNASGDRGRTPTFDIAIAVGTPRAWWFPVVRVRPSVLPGYRVRDQGTGRQGQGR